MEFEQLLQKAREYLPPDKLGVVERAYDFALKAHQGQLRVSGESYVQHSLETAYIVACLKLDANAVAAALLHDVPEDCPVPLSDIEKEFGPEVRQMVDGVTKLSSIYWRKSADKEGKEQYNAENIRKMLVAMAEDIRVVFIKLADRLHNMRTLGALPPPRQKAIANETLEIYAPLAHRLGIWDQKSELEDLSFSYLYPVECRRVNHLVAKRQEEQRAVIEQAIQTLREELKNVGLEAEVSGRTKNLYGIYRKMERYQEQGKDFGDIHDILALRIVVREVSDCYHALGVIHSLWHPIAGEFDDYIASPKENGYQSLHTTVMCFGTTPLEIQIRTYEMHHTAEFGVTAHWLYKEGAKADTQFERRISWFRQLLEWHKEIGGTAEFLESVKTDLFNDQVYVYTPKGEIKALPIGSTPLDFAYCVHTNLGHRCIGAKVNGRLQPLNHALRNGDTVEVIVSKKSRGPSRDWLNPHLGYIKSSRARQRVRQWFNKREQEENLERGKETLEKELKRLGIAQPDREAMALLFNYQTVDELYIAIGCGDLSSNRIALKLAEGQDQPKLIQAPSRVKQEDADIRVLGVGQLLTSLARCCNPLPGDEVIGYITRTKGVTIHRRSCPNIGRVDDDKRLVSVDWGGRHQFYPAVVRIDAWDRLGLLRDICTLVTDEGVNIVGVSSTEGRDHTTSLLLTLETQGMAQLTRILAKLESINNVISVTRCTAAR